MTTKQMPTASTSPDTVMPRDLHVAQPERDREDLDHRPRHPAEDDQVDRDREVQRAKAAQKRRRLAAVADLGELDVGHHVRAPPEPREEEHGEHSAHQHVPPQPVAGDAVRGDEARHDERRVGGERRRDHRRAGEPPRHLRAREEVLLEALAASLREDAARCRPTARSSATTIAQSIAVRFMGSGERRWASGDASARHHGVGERGAHAAIFVLLRVGSRGC